MRHDIYFMRNMWHTLYLLLPEKWKDVIASIDVEATNKNKHFHDCGDHVAGEIFENSSGNNEKDMSVVHRTQFLKDSVIAKSLIFRLFSQVFLTIWGLFHAHSFVGVENIPEKGALLISMHTTHNTGSFDIQQPHSITLWLTLEFMCFYVY